MTTISKHTTYKLTGNTFGCKEEIKKLGGTWDKPGQFWLLSVGGMKDIGGKKYALEQLQKKGVNVEAI
jgi:hypothetical protein